MANVKKAPISKADLEASIKAATNCFKISVTNFNGHTVWLGKPEAGEYADYCRPVYNINEAATFCVYPVSNHPGWFYLTNGVQWLSFTSLTVGDYYLDFSSGASAVMCQFVNNTMLLSAQGSLAVGYLSYWENGDDRYFYCENAGTEGYTICIIATNQ